MKLLFDQNLSPRLVTRLADLFPGSNHVSLLRLDKVPDTQVWLYAHDLDFVIVTKDADFGELSTLRGFPPKIIWLQVGNCTTSTIENILRQHAEAIERLAHEDDIGILALH
jgi:predicted nuclease of predicted toxin-antitoxin system